jgi:hypothetical protein
MSIQGKTVVFTGKISKPRHEFQKLVEENGGIAGSDVTSKTDYLVVGEKPGSKLIRAQLLNIRIISEEEFLKLIEEPSEEQETPLSAGERAELDKHLVNKTCFFCKRVTKQFDTWIDTDTCFMCETGECPKCPKCGNDEPTWIDNLKMYYCISCSNWFKAPYSWNAYKNNHHHYWFRKTEEEEKTIEECFCGAILITHSDGRWEKHEPSHIIEQAKKEAHEYAVEEEKACYKRREEEKRKEAETFKFIESLSPSQIELIKDKLK